MSDSLRPHESQHARPPCPSPTPGVHSNSCPSSRWCHPAISSSVVPFSSCPQSHPASGSFPMSQLFTWGGPSIGVSASASVLPMNTQDWSPLGWTGWETVTKAQLWVSWMLSSPWCKRATWRQRAKGAVQNRGGLALRGSRITGGSFFLFQKFLKIPMKEELLGLPFSYLHWTKICPMPWVLHHFKTSKPPCREEWDSPTVPGSHLLSSSLLLSARGEHLNYLQIQAQRKEHFSVSETELSQDILSSGGAWNQPHTQISKDLLRRVPTK